MQRSVGLSNDLVHLEFERRKREGVVCALELSACARYKLEAEARRGALYWPEQLHASNVGVLALHVVLRYYYLYHVRGERSTADGVRTTS